ncbi:MAG: hypothetical protein C4340_01340 [Armatimonadota bacterium]
MEILIARWTVARTDANLWQVVSYAGAATLVSAVLMFLLSRIPSNFRRPLVGIFIFVAGLIWILDWALPKAAVRRASGESNPITPLPFWPFEYNLVMDKVIQASQVLSGVLLGLGVLSILRVHVKKLTKRQQDWPFSLVLLVSMAAMIVIGLGEWVASNREAAGMPGNHELVKTAFSVVFNDMLQILDAAMFSLIAFFILSAAYRAFRIRSVEATIMMAVALIVLLGFIPLAMAVTAGLPVEGFASNFRIENMKTWILLNMSTPALRAIDLGLGLGLLAMALRIMLGLEKGVAVD